MKLVQELRKGVVVSLSEATVHYAVCLFSYWSLLRFSKLAESIYLGRTLVALDKRDKRPIC